MMNLKLKYKYIKEINNTINIFRTQTLLENITFSWRLINSQNILLI